MRWLKAPEPMLASDPDAKAMLERFKVPMPNQGLSKTEIRQYIAYIKWVDANLQSHPHMEPEPAKPGAELPSNETLCGGVPPPGTGDKGDVSGTIRREGKK